MDIAEAKDRFIETWGQMSSRWGINRNMAHIHALLLSSNKPLCAEDIMDHLQISRGSVCENIKDLLDWELIYKKHVVGERKVHYTAEKDMWVVFRQIVKQRKRKELDPLTDTLQELSKVECEDQDSVCFKKLIHDINDLSLKSDQFLNRFCNGHTGNISSLLLKLIK